MSKIPPKRVQPKIYSMFDNIKAVEYKQNVDIEMSKHNIRMIENAKKKRKRQQERISELIKKKKNNDSDLEPTNTIILDAYGIEHPNIIIDDEECDLLENNVLMKKPKSWKQRPDYWKEITQYYLESNNIAEVLNVYKSEFKGKSDNQIKKTIKKWVKNLKDGKEMQQIGKAPVYGKNIDAELYNNVLIRREKGLPVDTFILSKLLLPLLRKYNKESLLQINGGKYIFEESWARKFFKRWNLTKRAATTKTREKPNDLEAKKNVFITVASEIFRRHDIPPQLVINCDETGVLFVPAARYTFTMKGSKKVRAIGVGCDKAQFTATIAVTETGEALKTQLIFGGTTARCHPGGANGIRYNELFFDHSASHWQTPETYIRYIQNIIIPYKDNFIATNNLPRNQCCILKQDLHYSHIDKDVLELMHRHNIIPLMIPANCTDWIQECDVVVNKPFKAAIRKAFKVYLHEKFEEYIAVESNDPNLWAPNLNIGVIKPLIPIWVLEGIKAIQCTKMKDAIRKAFAEEGCIGTSRKHAIQLQEREILSMEDLTAKLMIRDPNNDEEDDPEEIAIDDYLEN